MDFIKITIANDAWIFVYFKAGDKISMVKEALELAYDWHPDSLLFVWKGKFVEDDDTLVSEFFNKQETLSIISHELHRTDPDISPFPDFLDIKDLKRMAYFNWEGAGARSHNWH